MKYYKQYTELVAQAQEITKEEAKRILSYWWAEERLDDIFKHNKMFRLYTPVSEVWTRTDDGMTPMAGYYGVCE